MNTDFFGPSAERNSWFGGLNAGVKLVVAGVLVLAAILIQDPVTAGIIFGLELAAAFSMMIRSLAMILPTFAFVLSTDPTDLGDSLAQTFRLPARFVLAALAALRLVGILFGEWNTLGQARRARGLGAGQGPLGRIKTGAGQAFALMVQAIRRGSRLAVTMEARGFGTGKRSWARVPAYSRRDAYVAVAAAVIVACAYGVSLGLGTLRFLWQ